MIFNDEHVFVTLLRIVALAFKQATENYELQVIRFFIGIFWFRSNLFHYFYGFLHCLRFFVVNQNYFQRKCSIFCVKISGVNFRLT